MADILKSVVLGIAFIATLFFSAPILNDDEKKKTSVVPENSELSAEKNIHIPL